METKQYNEYDIIFTSYYTDEALNLLPVLDLIYDDQLMDKNPVKAKMLAVGIGDHRYSVIYRNLLITSNLADTYNINVTSYTGYGPVSRGVRLEDLMDTVKDLVEKFTDSPVLETVEDVEKYFPQVRDFRSHSEIRKGLPITDYGKFHDARTRRPKYQIKSYPLIRLLDKLRILKDSAIMIDSYKKYHLVHKKAAVRCNVWGIYLFTCYKDYRPLYFNKEIRGTTAVVEKLKWSDRVCNN